MINLTVHGSRKYTRDRMDERISYNLCIFSQIIMTECNLLNYESMWIYKVCEFSIFFLSFCFYPYFYLSLTIYHISFICIIHMSHLFIDFYHKYLCLYHFLFITTHYYIILYTAYIQKRRRRMKHVELFNLLLVTSWIYPQLLENLISITRGVYALDQFKWRKMVRRDDRRYFENLDSAIQRFRRRQLSSEE